MVKVNDNRMAWMLTMLALIGAAAAALGVQTPVARIIKVEAAVAEHETRIQRIEDTRDAIEAIAKAVHAEIPKSRGNR